MDTAGRTALPALTALALAVGLLAGCSSASDATPAPVSSSAAPAATTAPVADVTPAPDATSAPAAAPVADQFSQVVNGVLYQGSEDAPVKIGTDTPGQPPALDGTLPDPQADFATYKAAAEALAGEKYVVVIAPVIEDGGVRGESPILGYRWLVFRVNEYGSFKSGETSSTFATQQEAIDAPKELGGRALDRAEYVVVYY